MLLLMLFYCSCHFVNGDVMLLLLFFMCSMYCGRDRSVVIVVATTIVVVAAVMLFLSFFCSCVLCTPAGARQDLPLPLDNNTDEHNLLAPQRPVAPAAMPLSQQEPPSSMARQTRSGRVIKNTPRYARSISLRDQGIVAWELLIDQHKQEDQPTAATQFATQRALEDPIAFATTANPDILYWDQQAMKAHDRDKFLEAVCCGCDGVGFVVFG